MLDREGVPVEVEDDHPATGTGHPDHLLDRPRLACVDPDHAPCLTDERGEHASIVTGAAAHVEHSAARGQPELVGDQLIESAVVGQSVRASINSTKKRASGVRSTSVNRVTSPAAEFAGAESFTFLPEWSTGRGFRCSLASSVGRVGAVDPNQHPSSHWLPSNWLSAIGKQRSGNPWFWG
jgi:hypothetical protein